VRRLLIAIAAIGLLTTSTAGTAVAGGPPSVGFYADGDLYRTIGTPTDFSTTGAPASSFEPIYALGNGLRNVAEAAPGKPGFKGGRWMVLPITWVTVAPYQITDADEIHALAETGAITIASTPIRMFECPVIHLP
jgi:hypothetical protein